MKYELRSIPDNAPEAFSYVPQITHKGWRFGVMENARFTDAIYAGDRMIFRFRPDALQPIMGGASFAERCLSRLKFGPRDG